MSQLKVDSIVPSGGVVSGADGGGIVQVIVGSNNTYSTTTSTSYIDFITASITPRSTSNKILCIVSAYSSHLNSEQGDLILTRSNTQIYPTSSNAGSYNVAIGIREWTEWNAVPTTMTYLDSPSTTSATTYKVRVRCNNSNAVSLNRSRSVNTSSFGHGYYAESILTLMEVSG